MKFILMVHNREDVIARLPPEEIARVVEAHAAYSQALVDAGVYRRDGYRLRPGAEMTRITQPAGPTGPRQVFDGPHAEAKEVVGGFYVLECATKEEALAWARRCPLWDSDTLELRPVWD